MTTVQQIEQAIGRLPARELAEFRSWFQQFDAAAWDKQFEQNVESGKLDEIAARAIDDLEAGKAQPL